MMQLGDFSIQIDNIASVGVSVRTESREDALLPPAMAVRLT